MHLLCLCLLEEEQKTALCSTLSEILESACSSPSTGFCLVTWAKGQSPHTSTHTNTQTQSQSQTQDMPVPESSQPPQEQQPSESYVCQNNTNKWWPTNINDELFDCVVFFLCHALMLQHMCVFSCAKLLWLQRTLALSDFTVFSSKWHLIFSPCILILVTVSSSKQIIMT